jgi:hypothetical protein
MLAASVRCQEPERPFLPPTYPPWCTDDRGCGDTRGPEFCSLLDGAKSTCASFADASSAGRGSRGYSYSSALANAALSEAKVVLSAAGT